jgi:pSer/pThr/pTyr-binding forkhead associated (FHA) protein
VGRAPDSAVHLDQPEISRQHARIFWDGERITVSDLASTNGTFINGWRLEPNATKPLVPGDEISFGGTVQWQVTIG